MSLTNDSVIVQSLIGKKHLEFYLQCLKSLVHFCEQDIKLLLHTDGSLNQKHKEEVLSELPNSVLKIIDSQSNSVAVLDNLRGRPHCQKFRKESIWGIEFFDPLFAEPNDQVSYYIDADFLFFRPFAGLFKGEEVKDGAIFLQDDQWDAYCIRPWHLLGSNPKPNIVQGITTALVFWDKMAIDWDYLEWFLGEAKYHKICDWIMPTAQAGLARRCKAKTVCSEQIKNLYPNAQLTQSTIGGHLLGSYRKEWLKKLDLQNSSNSRSEERIFARFHSCSERGAWAYGLNQAKRWVNTRLNFW